MLNQWCKEKVDWVCGGNVTLSYDSIISSSFSYVGLGWFKRIIDNYPYFLCGQFSFEDISNNYFIDSCYDIIQTVEVNKKYIFFCVNGKKKYKSLRYSNCRTYCNLTYDNISLCPINKYKLKYSSNDNNVLRVNKFRIVYGNFFANVIIICNK